MRNSFKKLIFKILIVIFLVLMVLAPVPTLKGAENGLLLWFNTILPTLLPFIIISNIIIGLNITDYICYLFGPILKRVFRVSLSGCYPIIIGALSGFPIGAKSCADLVKTGKIPVAEGQFLMSLCNNASIMFITSYIAISNLNMPSHQYGILGIIILSALISSLLYRILYSREMKTKKHTLYHLKHTIKATEVSAPYNTGNKPATSSFSFQLIDDAILDGFEVITKVGGYIILFSILAQIILDILPPIGMIKLIIVGMLEITTGIHFIGSSALNMSYKFILIIAVTAFGGFSSVAQTKSVLGDTDLQISHYIKAKLLNVAIAVVLSILYLNFFIA